ncbi:hypothetical protein [Methyloterricola oryzae]|uniref:hypothetical protein n=1 Tax=Methyloterricola oryzae TaxID=1495050 RepID=UPI0005EAF5B4|nr:hypothetical protein [Methyloterricola oryzae]
MKQTTRQGAAKLALAIGLLSLQACAEWSATPARTEASYGDSVRNMVNNQTYNPAKAQHPEALAPDGIEANKADAILGKAYRGDIGKPESVREHTVLGTPGRSSSGSSGR